MTLSAGNLVVEEVGAIENKGTFEITSAVSITALNSQAQFINDGTFIKSAGDTSTISTSFVNQGSVDADESLIFANFIQNGLFAELSVNGDSSVKVGRAALNGGTVLLGAASEFVVDVQHAHVGAAASALSGVLFVGEQGAQQLIQVNFAVGSTVQVLGGGVIFRSVTVVQAGQLVWLAGSIEIDDATTLTNAAGAVFTTSHDGEFKGDSGTAFINNGTFRKVAGTGTTTFEMQTGGFFHTQLINSPSALFELNSGKVSIRGYGTTNARFNIAAGSDLIIERVSALRLLQGASFHGDGWVKLLRAIPGGSATLEIDTVVTIPRLHIDGNHDSEAALSGEMPPLGQTAELGKIHVTHGLVWHSGRLQTVTLQIGQNVTAAIGAPAAEPLRVLTGSILHNLGTIRWTEGDIRLDVATPGGFAPIYSRIVNDGTLGGGSFEVRTSPVVGVAPPKIFQSNADHTGHSVELHEGAQFGRIAPSANGVLTQVLVPILNAGGTLRLDGLRVQQISQSAGHLELFSGTAEVVKNVTVSDGHFQFCASTNLHVGGRFRLGSFAAGLLDGATLQVDEYFLAERDSILDATGVIIGDVTYLGTLYIGRDRVGTLEVRGEVRDTLPTSSAKGFLVMDIGGRTAGTQHDLLKTTTRQGKPAANLNLTGYLSVGPLNGFVPVVGDVFDLIQAAAGATITGQLHLIEQRGTFANVPFTEVYTIPGVFRIKW